MVQIKNVMTPETDYVAIVNSFNRGYSDALAVTKVNAIAELLGLPKFEIKYYPNGSSRTLMLVRDKSNSI